VVANELSDMLGRAVHPLLGDIEELRFKELVP